MGQISSQLKKEPAPSEVLRSLKEKFELSHFFLCFCKNYIISKVAGSESKRTEQKS